MRLCFRSSTRQPFDEGSDSSLSLPRGLRADAIGLFDELGFGERS
jgi:hypothetical protein